MIVPGSGTFGMEAVARQFVNREKVLIIRNGWFSFRWSQIFDMGGLGDGVIVCQPLQQGSGPQEPWVPCDAEEVAATIRAEKPKLDIRAPRGNRERHHPHRRLPAHSRRRRTRGGRALHARLIALRAMRVDMKALDIDVLDLRSAEGLEQLAVLRDGDAERARPAGHRRDDELELRLHLKKWMQLAEGFEKGQHAYHATMPTDSLIRLRDTMKETRDYGFEKVRAEQIELGKRVRALLESRGFPSVAAEAWKAPGVVVSYTTDQGIQSGKKFLEAGLQTASGVPLQCGEGPDFKTFRIGALRPRQVARRRPRP